MNSLNVLTIGYYDDFARFFLSVKSGLKKSKIEVRFKYLSLYWSGFIYWIYRSGNVSLISFRAMINGLLHYRKYENIVITQDSYRGVRLDSVIEYHRKLYINDKSLKIQVCSYIDLLNSIFNKFSPDILICSSDSRMISEISTLIASQRNVKVLYFEQGPFGTTVLDKKGVNANSSIRGYQATINDYEAVNKEINLFINRKRSKKYKRRPFYRAMDYLIEFLLKNTILYPVDLLHSTNNTFFSPKKTSLNFHQKDERSNEIKFILILQVPFDVNMIYHSPYFSSHYEILASVHKNLPQNASLTVREHPLYKGKYEHILYSYCMENHITIENDQSLSNAFATNDIVIVNNSTVGLEAIMAGKTTVVLGNAFYDSSNICLKLTDKHNLSNILESSLSYSINISATAAFNHKLYFSYLLDGHFRDQNIESIAMLTAKRILKEVDFDY